MCTVESGNSGLVKEWSVRGACGRARPTGPDLKWAFCDVIGVYRDLIEFPQGKKRVFPWLKTAK